ncbi:MAG: type II toxin-antitoxin system death-on-curing family toxin [Mycoplasmoidaceae bacterium]
MIKKSNKNMINQIYFTIIENSSDDPEHIFNNQNKNSLLSFINNKYYFDSKINGKKEVDFKLFYLEYNERTIDYLTSLYENVFDNARNLSDEPMESESDSKKKLNSVIISVFFNYFRSKKIKNISIFDIFAEIFIKLLQNHILKNGNKRFSLSYLIFILRIFGYHFKWSWGKNKDYKKYEKFVEEYVIKLQTINNKKPNVDKIMNEIKNWIIKNVVVKLPI